MQIYAVKTFTRLENGPVKNDEFRNKVNINDMANTKPPHPQFRPFSDITCQSVHFGLKMKSVSLWFENENGPVKMTNSEVRSIMTRTKPPHPQFRSFSEITCQSVSFRFGNEKKCLTLV